MIDAGLHSWPAGLAIGILAGLGHHWLLWQFTSRMVRSRSLLPWLAGKLLRFALLVGIGVFIAAAKADSLAVLSAGVAFVGTHWIVLFAVVDHSQAIRRRDG